MLSHPRKTHAAVVMAACLCQNYDFSNSSLFLSLLEHSGLLYFTFVIVPDDLWLLPSGLSLDRWVGTLFFLQGKVYCYSSKSICRNESKIRCGKKVFLFIRQVRLLFYTYNRVLLSLTESDASSPCLMMFPAFWIILSILLALKLPPHPPLREVLYSLIIKMNTTSAALTENEVRVVKETKN